MTTQLKNHILFTEYDIVRELCEPLAAFNIVGFIYIKKFPDGRFLDLSNQLQWSEFFLNKYLSGSYPSKDATNHMLSSEHTNIWFADHDNIVWQEGIAQFSFGNGISINKTRNGYCETFCFYSVADNYSVNQFYINSYELLAKFCDYFCEKVSKIIEKAEQRNDYLTAPDQYLNSTRVVEQGDEKSAFLNKILRPASLSCSLALAALSKREMECVYLSANGMSVKQIAKKIFLSDRTVETHLTNARRKWGCSNTKELIYKALPKYQSLIDVLG